jgi:hypothetical protein
MVGAVIYVRVSTKKQTENLSLPTQLRAFAERILPRASDLWVQASLNQRQRFRQLFFPDGIAFDGNGFVGTRVPHRPSATCGRSGMEMKGWLANRSSGQRREVHLRSQKNPASYGGQPSPESRAKVGGPKFRELEPVWQMAQTGGGASRRCLIAVDDASRL